MFSNTSHAYHIWASLLFNGAIRRQVVHYISQKQRSNHGGYIQTEPCLDFFICTFKQVILRVTALIPYEAATSPFFISVRVAKSNCFFYLSQRIMNKWRLIGGKWIKSVSDRSQRMPFYSIHHTISLRAVNLAGLMLIFLIFQRADLPTSFDVRINLKPQEHSVDTRTTI